MCIQVRQTDIMLGHSCTLQHIYSVYFSHKQLKQCILCKTAYHHRITVNFSTAMFVVYQFNGIGISAQFTFRCLPVIQQLSLQFQKKQKKCT